MMPIPWKLWEGQVVDSIYPLRRYLGGTEQSGVFLTQYANPDLENAAIKLIAAPANDAELLAQWDRAAELSHPHLLRLLRRGSTRISQLALDYVVTEYADENLADVLSDRPLTPAEAREMLPPILEALAYIHREGLVHGHVRPSNVMAVGDQLKLSADGISRVGELEEGAVTASSYDPPEFAERGYSPLGDVWSFGMTLVQALTQRLPSLKDRGEEPALPDNLPAEFRSLAQECLRIDPRKRASLEEVQALLRGPAAVPLPVVQTPVEPEAAPVSAARKWTSAALVAVAAVGLAAILAIPRLTKSLPAEEPVAARNTMVEAAKTEAPATVPPPVQTPSETPAEPVASSDAAASKLPAPPASKTPEPAAAPAAPETTRTVAADTAQIAQQAMPDVPDQARRTIRGKVVVKVVANVDNSGHVASARVESENSHYFAGLALKAAQRWTFQPGGSAGDWALKFVFTTKGTDVQSARVAR